MHRVASSGHVLLRSPWGARYVSALVRHSLGVWHAGCPIATFGGPAMRALHDLVQRNQRRFSQPPLGPLGALLSVDEIKWAGAIEAALKKGFLESWIVDSRADHSLLMVRPCLALALSEPQKKNLCKRLGVRISSRTAAEQNAQSEKL